jgi:alanyl-tRNA synthetase
VLDRTPFYGEMGGQVGDRGELAGGGARLEVVDTRVDSGFILHVGHLREGQVVLGAALKARVDAGRRQAIRRAHSATHLLHYALQKRLGQHAQQQGSKVDADWLRFDFSHPKAVTAEDLARIEDEVNRKVLDAEPIRWANMPLAQARTLGATMLFGEKYPDVVRVVSVGEFSKELCGGTHLDHTGQIGLFKITAEESIAAGTRRITALTGLAALARVRAQEESLRAVAAALKAPAEEAPARIEAMAKELRQLKKQVAAGTSSLAGPVVQPSGAGGYVDPKDPVAVLLSRASDTAGVRVIVEELAPGAAPPAMRDLIDQLRRTASPIAVLLASRQDESKVMLLAGLSRDLVARGLDAVAWVRQAADLVGGSGGGRADLAQAGGKNAERLAEALAAGRARIAEMLGA